LLARYLIEALNGSAHVLGTWLEETPPGCADAHRGGVMTNWWMAGPLVAALALGIGCNRGPDPKQQVDDELKAEHLDKDVNVDYDRNARVLHLKGTVDSSTDKSRAEHIADRVVGTSGKVADEITVRNVNEHTADDMDGAIRKELAAKVDNNRILQDRHIDFDVNNGVVTIKGDVRNAREKQEIAEMAKSTANVREVVDALHIDPSIKNNVTRHPATTDRTSEHRPATDRH
jgi:osmotically-inducible protein OsmY